MKLKGSSALLHVAIDLVKKFNFSSLLFLFVLIIAHIIEFDIIFIAQNV